MKHSDPIDSIRGISLIEALVAVAIVSVGLLAIAKLHGELLSSAGDSKARAEAMQIAEGEIEKLRNATTRDDLVARLDKVAQEASGKNTEFALQWGWGDAGRPLAGNSINAFEPQVTIQWTDRRGEQQQLVLDSAVTWTNPRTSVALADPDIGGGNFVERPTGRARMGGDDIMEGDDVTVVTNQIGGTFLDDGTEMRSDGEGTVQLVRDGDVLMTMETTNPGEMFSTISGRLYFDNNPDVQLTRLLTSDAGLCTRRGREPLGQPIDPFVDDDAGYEYFYYQCYVGEGWYGNVGVLRLDGAHNNDRVCVGDPDAEASGAWDSREPRLSTTRRYRAFVSDGSGGYVAVGMGREPAGSTSGNPSYVAQAFTNHDFLTTRMSGQANCGNVLEATGDTFTGNAGRNYCLHPDGVGCGDDSLPSDPEPEPFVITLVEGSIDYGGGNPQNRPTVSAMEFEGGSCDVEMGTHGQQWEAIVDFTCEIDREGWTGGDWFGDMTLTHDGELCAFSQDFAEGGSAWRHDGNTIRFDGIQEVERLEMDTFRVRRAGDC
ncbi:prepilin-type N-terminal cleavage/methylation domain-containing protein [Thioalkalivibrio sp. ALJ9]|uniref:type IV pilus modification PilV family protein n=1 Tax=Thioalkalivibrio sp. ALJ9 TaxID=1158758 RepID=UPI00056DAD16|nr:prepilin-type N-terminal cleavage/methylation domain-containing protein [Thioalkalivibrio sp. ALJ9]